MTSFISQPQPPPIVILIGMLIVHPYSRLFHGNRCHYDDHDTHLYARDHAFHYDPIWFGVMMLIALETGLITPPSGVTLFVMKGVAPPDITMSDIWRAVTPYVIVDILCIVLVLVMPSIATIVRSLMGMK